MCIYLVILERSGRVRAAGWICGKHSCLTERKTWIWLPPSAQILNLPLVLQFPNTCMLTSIGNLTLLPRCECVNKRVCSAMIGDLSRVYFQPSPSECWDRLQQTPATPFVHRAGYVIVPDSYNDHRSFTGRGFKAANSFSNACFHFTNRCSSKQNSNSIFSSSHQQSTTQTEAFKWRDLSFFLDVSLPSQSRRADWWRPTVSGVCTEIIYRAAI